MQFTQLSTTACQTVYRVDGLWFQPCDIILWAVSGGSLSVDIFQNGKYHNNSKNFPVCAKFTDDKCFPGKGKYFKHYVHQNPLQLQGPEIGVDVPTIEVEAWLTLAFPCYLLCKAREQIIRSIIGEENPRSKRLHMPGAYLWAKCDVIQWGRIGFHPITIEAAHVSGCVSPSFEEWDYLPKFWQESALAINAAYYPRGRDNTYRLEQLDNHDWMLYLRFLLAYKRQSDPKFQAPGMLANLKE